MTDHETIIAVCPECGLRATVLKDRLPALIDRWHREHERMQKAKAS